MQFIYVGTGCYCVSTKERKNKPIHDFFGGGYPLLFYSYLTHLLYSPNNRLPTSIGKVSTVPVLNIQSQEKKMKAAAGGRYSSGRYIVVLFSTLLYSTLLYSTLLYSSTVLVQVIYLYAKHGGVEV